MKKCKCGIVAEDGGTKYASPRAKVVSVNARGVICASPSVTEWGEGSESNVEMG